MNTTVVENNQQADAWTPENFSKAMNFIGQNLLTALTKSLEELPPAFRNRQLVTQAMSAFLTNIIYQQFPKDDQACQQMLDEMTKLVRSQLQNISI